MKKHIVAILAGIYLFSSVKVAHANPNESDPTTQAPITTTVTEKVNSTEQADVIGETTTNETTEVTAEKTPVSEEELKETAGVIPGTILYKLERAIEDLNIAITKSEEKLAALKSQYAVERAAEAAILTENGDFDMADKAVEEYMETIASVSEHLNTAIEAKDEAVETMGKLTEAFASSQNILKVVLDKAPEDAKAMVEEALNNQDGAISAIQGFYAAKNAFFAAKQEFAVAKKELKAARESGNEEAIKAAEAKVAEAEAYKDEMEALKDAAEKSKEEVKSLVEKTEKLIKKSTEHVEKANEKMDKLSEQEDKDEDKEIKEDKKAKEESKKSEKQVKEEIKKQEEKAREELKKQQENTREEKKKVEEKQREQLKKEQEKRKDEMKKAEEKNKANNKN